MFAAIVNWDIYEIQTTSTQINGVKLRGRIRKFCIEQSRNVFVENTQDIENGVRFAIPSDEDPSAIQAFIKKIVADASIELVRQKVANPVLSKLKVNIDERYALTD